MKIQHVSKVSFFSVNVAYYCKFSEGKDISIVKHGLLVRKQCTIRLAPQGGVKRLRIVMNYTI